MRGNKTKLFAPASFWVAYPEIIKAVCNGCGTSGWKGKLVPDKLLGLDIKLACEIHDWMYHFGETVADKIEADRVFLNNMIRVIDANMTTFWNKWLQWLRRRMARGYYDAVDKFGGPAFWSGKNNINEMSTKTTT